MPVGTAVLDFGAFPGSPEASVAVTGQGSISGGSAVEAYVQLADSADHSADEHRVEALKVAAGSISNGVGFTVYGECTNGRAYGQFNVQWVWV